jgi:hypothetical protein
MVRTMKKALLLILFLVAVSAVYAAPFTYNYDAITDSIYNNESAYYNLTINNNNDYPDRFQLYTISAFWDVSPTLVQAAPGSINKVTVEIAPLDSKIYGPQLVPVTIKSLSDEYSVVENFYVYVKPSNYTPLEYVPNIAMEVRMPEEIDPRNPISLEVYMRNRNPLNLDQLIIEVTSDLFSKSYITTLGPLEEKTNQILFADLNPLQKPGTYSVDVKLIYKNETISQSNKQLIIKEYSDVQLEQTTTKGLFSTKEKISLYNDGNNDVVKLVKVKKNFFEKLFTSTSAKPVSLKEDGISYLSWNVPLKPRDSYTLTITTNYTSLVLLILLIIILVISYYVFRSPVVLFKRAKIASSSEHGITDIKVKLHMKNRSGRIIRNIKIIDKYPKLLTLEEETSLGSMKPTKLLSGDKANNLLTWNLEVLDPYEERLLVYRLKSGLNIVGNVSLPASKIKFHTASGDRSYLSNKVKLLHRSNAAMSEKK